MRKAIQLCVALFFSTLSIGWGQTRISILSSDITDIVKGSDDSRTFYLRGNVGLQQDVAKMYCDSAILIQPANTFQAFGNVRIVQSDTIRVQGKRLDYNGNDRVFVISKEVILTTPSSRLETTSLRFNRNNSTAYFITRSTLERKSLALTADVGSFNTDADLVKLRGNVIAKDTSFYMTTDTLLYSPNKNHYEFAGPTEMIKDSTVLNCHSGNYEADERLLHLRDGATMRSPKRFIKSNSLEYNLKIESGVLVGNAKVADTTEGFVLESDYINYASNPVFVDAYTPVHYKQSMNSDTLYAIGDSLFIRSDSTDKQVYLKGATQFFSPDFQGKSSNFFYDESTQFLSLYPMPTLWSSQSQFEADSAALKLLKKQLDSIYMIGNVKIMNQTKDSLYFDQVVGKSLSGYFDDNQMKMVRLEGNTQSLLFNVSETQAQGVNNSTCSWLRLKFMNGEVKRVQMARDVQAKYAPLNQAETTSLNGCTPKFEQRPTKSDLLP